MKFRTFLNCTVIAERKPKSDFLNKFQYNINNIDIQEKDIDNIFDFWKDQYFPAHNMSHHVYTICKRAKLIIKMYKNGLFKKKSVQKSKNP